MPAYQQSGLTLYEGCQRHADAVRALQRDLRALGYLGCGIDGIYGSATTAAVRALQYDLLHNQGISHCGRPVRAAVVMTSYNRDENGLPRVEEINGVCDPKLADAVAELVADPKIGLVPEVPDPLAANAEALRQVAEMPATLAPAPFVLAVAEEESDGEHFRHLGEDHFLNVGFFHEDRIHRDFITARSYGLGQYTLYCQPPDKATMEKLRQPESNVSMIAANLSDKLERFLAGGTADTTAGDRVAAHGHIAPRHCKYPPEDPRCQKDCHGCVAAMAKREIHHGTPLYEGSGQKWHATSFYSMADYADVPDPAGFACDWPYAVRRLSGSGLNSYHYQAHVLQHLRADSKAHS